MTMFMVVMILLAGIGTLYIVLHAREQQKNKLIREQLDIALAKVDNTFDVLNAALIASGRQVPTQTLLDLLETHRKATDNKQVQDAILKLIIGDVK